MIPAHETVRHALVDTPHGPWWMAWTSRGVCVTAEGDMDPAAFRREVEAWTGVAPEPGDPAGVPAEVDWSVMPGGFRGEVLRACAGIPAGEVRTYGELAAAAGRPGAARAVGTTMATNRVPLLVPCHRVVRGDGRIGEYGAGGPSRKAAMLAKEGVEVRDGRLVGAR